jgi:D-alanyl-D-alanine carboxypeptidase
VSGFVSMNLIYPDDKFAVTVLTNEDASSAASALARKVAALVTGGSSVSDESAKDAAEKRALAIFTGLQDGKLDRSQLTPFCDAYFTPEAVHDFASSLKPLGTPSGLKQVSEEKRGGMVFRSFSVSFPDKHLRVTTFEMPDGKLEQYLVIPSGS